MNQASDNPTRRRFLTATGMAALTAGTASCVNADTSAANNGAARFYQPDRSYAYEVRRTEAEWRSLLSPTDYKILREGHTEVQKSSPLWQETRDGTYACKGCDLKAYDSRWKTPRDKGWVFFYHSEPNAVMTDIDGPNPAYGMNPRQNIALTEVHCRRCGSHFGHHLIVGNDALHCVNGASLNFKTA